MKRIRGSHHILRHPTIPDALPVPVHGKRGTLGNILRTAGIQSRRVPAASLMLTQASLVCGGFEVERPHDRPMADGGCVQTVMS